MRVLLVNKFWYPKGGSERYTFLLKDLLEANGHEVVSFGCEREHSNATNAGFECHEYSEHSDGIRNIRMHPVAALWNRHAARKLDELLKQNRPVIAHLQNFSREISPSILPVLRRHGVPVVWTLHDLDAFRPGYRHQSAWAHRAFAWAEYALHQRVLDVYRKYVDAIIAPSRFAAETAQEWGWKGRVEVLSNFVPVNQESVIRDQEAPSPPTPHSSQGKGGNEKQFLPLTSGGGAGGGGVLFVGRLVAEKGILDFLEAARRLPEIPFEVIGDGPIGISNFKFQISNCQWLGSLPPEETQRHIAGAAIVVVPSTIPEIAPYVILEAMAAGVPVVASNIGGIPELVRDGETGVLVPPQDPTALAKTIEMVYRDEVQRRRFGERARAIATAEYGPERHYERLIAIYEELRGI